MLLVAERADLADVVKTWMERRRLDRVELARLSGIARNTLYRILEGMAAQPETLRKIAKGLATDPHTDEIDSGIRLLALRDFAQVAGIDLADDAPPPTLEQAIRAEGIQSPRQAAKLAAFLRRYPNMSTDQRRLVDALIDHLDDE